MAVNDIIRITLGYCLIAFVNALLPALVSSAAYLIVPYPRSIVILIQCLPAVATKALLPYAFPRIARWRRVGPLAIAGCWIIATFIIDISPPNVPPWLRVLGVVLASVASATGDVFWLGGLSLGGQTGFTGWAVGDGIGGLACIVFPHFVTVHMGRPLRDSLACAWYLVALLLASHYLILPQNPQTANIAARPGSKGKEAVRIDVESSMHLQDMTSEAECQGVRSIRMHVLLQPLVMPLFLAFAGQSIVVPGISRALAMQPLFETHAEFLAAYGEAFHFGSLMARSAIFFKKPAPKRHSLFAVIAALLVLSWLALFPVATMPILCFPIICVLGAAVGSLYVTVFASVVEEQSHESRADREFKLQFIGIGESLGLLTGGSAGAMLEASLCGHLFARGERWCDMTR